MAWDDAVLKKTWDLRTVKSGKPVTLQEKDIKSAFGGEGLIYLKNGVIHKVYPDNKFLPQERKLVELQQLKHPNIIVPQDILVDSHNKMRGFTMPYVDAYELCMLFPKAFKDRHKLTPENITDLVKNMQGAVRYVHSMGFLQVDGNEMNCLVDKKFKQVYYIDTNSYQTPNFPATAIMDSIKDPHSKGFNRETDWYSWAIVTFQMFIGIHPFKGIYKKNYTMMERMQRNISVFNPDVTIPAVCAPFDTIPQALRDWYEAVFEKGARLAPPDSYESRIIAHTRVTKQIGSDNFIITLLHTYQKPIIGYGYNYTMTENGLYQQDKAMLGLHDVAELVFGSNNEPILARLEGGKLRLFPVMSKVEMPVNFNANEIMSYQGRLYLRNNGDINEVTFVTLGQKTLPTLKKVGNVIETGTRMFDGCVVSSLSNVSHISIFPKTATCNQLQIPELAGHKVLDAKFDNGVLMVIAANTQGNHDKFIFRFEAGFKSYDVRVQENVQVSEINFTVLDTGVVLHMTDTGILEVFKAHPGAKDVIEIDDQAIDTDCILLKNGSQAMFARGEKLYKSSVQQQATAVTAAAQKGKRIVRDKNTGKLIDISKVTKNLIQKDPVFQGIYKDDPLLNAITGTKPSGNKTTGMI